MCGIVGYASSQPLPSDRDFFKQALYVDALRGRDSTGVFAIDTEDKATITKYAIEATDFISTTAFKKYMEGLKNTQRLMIGHNRAATKGTVVNKNAHPFRHNHISMVHNGSLWFHDNLHRGDDFDVDSEAICYMLSTKGTKDTLESLCGAFALVWHDAKENKLFMAANGERPLHLALSKDGKAVYWASELGMLKFLLERSSIVVDNYYEVTKELVHSFDLSVDLIGDSYEISEEFKSEEQVSWGYVDNTTPGKKSSVGSETFYSEDYWKNYTNGYPNGYGNTYVGKYDPPIGQVLDCDLSAKYEYRWSGNDRGRLVFETIWEDRITYITVYDVDITKYDLGDTIKVRVTATSFSDVKGEIVIESNIVPFQEIEEDEEVVDLVMGYMGVLVTLKEFGQQTQDGCAWCSQSVTPEDSKGLDWIGPRMFLCKSCSEDGHGNGGYAG